MSTLYVVATPIGNLEDITIRAIKTLLTAGVIACEDTRRTGQLLKILAEKYSLTLNTHNSPKKYISVRDWNEAEAKEKVIQELAFSDVALVSDAGTPLISDPGFKLVREARAAGYSVVPIPGPSAVTAALSAAGLPTNKFLFWGFLPKHWELNPGLTHVIYESPQRINRTLDLIKQKYPNSQIVLAREMTKIHEQFSVVNKDLVTKGEVTILVYVPE